MASATDDLPSGVKGAKPCRYWGVTIPVAKCDFHKFSEYLTHLPVGTFCRGQRETGKDGYDHLQVMCGWDNAKSQSAVIAELKAATGTAGFHVKALTTKLHAHRTYQYVHKDESAVPHSQFAFNCDQKWVPEYLRSGEIEAEEPVLKKVCRPTRRIIGLYGPPCTGKSYLARQMAEKNEKESVFYCASYSGNSKTRWLGDYKGEATVIIDEFRPDQFDRDYLKMMFDRMPQSLTTTMGGKSAMFDPSLIIFINNATKPEMLKFVNDPVFRSRVTSTHYMDQPVPAEFMPKPCQNLDGPPTF